MTILLVEDEREIAELIVDHIRDAGLVVDHMRSLAEAKDALSAIPYDLVLLDRRLPDGDGLKLVPELRQISPDARVIMLTALDSVSDKVEGLDTGADDYLIKPFEFEELLARIRASLRRPGGGPLPPIRLGALEYDFATRVVCVRGRPALFHGKELALFEALIRRAGRVVARKTLMAEVYGLDDETLPNALDVLVSRVRKRLASLDAAVMIHPARGIGYLLSEHAS
jgi:two-component system, OmpR family, response regulator